MNFLKTFIFIIFTLLLTTETVNSLFKNRADNLWKEKKPTDTKIIKLAEESLVHYNKEHGSNFFLDRILKAGKEYVKSMAHYFLKFIVTEDCGDDFKECSEIFYADVYDNDKHINHKLKFSVATKGNIPSF
uniref:Cystatin domain-containing protein n=1 Tax=Strongyloides papillosus TaxID=174720 RepID=A0A0N5BQC2_STREA